MRLCGDGCECVWAQRQPHVSFLYSLTLCTSLFLWDRVPYWPRSPQARWQDVHWAHRLLLLPSPQHWHYNYSLLCPDFFIWVLGTNCKSSCFKQILQWLSCPPVSTGPFRKIQDLFLKVLSLVTQSPFNSPPSQHCRDEGWVSIPFGRGHPYLTQDKA